MGVWGRGSARLRAAVRSPPARGPGRPSSASPSPPPPIVWIVWNHRCNLTNRVLAISTTECSEMGLILSSDMLFPENPKPNFQCATACPHQQAPGTGAAACRGMLQRLVPAAHPKSIRAVPRPCLCGYCGFGSTAPLLTSSGTPTHGLPG